MVDNWLQRYPLCSKDAQDIRKADDGAVLEMFKYFSKIVTDKVVYVQPLDIIFSSMVGMRVYQPFGIRKIKDVDENIDEIQSQVIQELKQAETTWDWIDYDWVDTTTGEMLTGYKPDDFMNTMVNNIE